MKKLIRRGLAGMFLLLQAPIVYGAEKTIVISPPEQVKITELEKLISAVVGLILIIAGLAAFIFLIWGGLEWITSGGDKAGVEAARGKILAAILGLIIVAASWAIFSFLQTFLGFTIIGGIVNLPLPYPH